MRASSLHKIGLYVSITLLNVAVIFTFVVTTLKPHPTLVAYIPESSLHRGAPTKQGIPIRIVIPRLAIDIPVGLGKYNPSNNTWAIDDQRAYYADVSSPLNNKAGNTLIYGHRLPTIFDKLSGLQPHDAVTVFTDTGYTFNYTYESREEVVPTNVSLFTNLGPPTLILQTCSGGWDQNRMLFSLKLSSVART